MSMDHDNSNDGFFSDPLQPSDHSDDTLASSSGGFSDVTPIMPPLPQLPIASNSQQQQQHHEQQQQQQHHEHHHSVGANIPLQQVLFEFTVHEPERHEKQKALDVPYWTYKVDATTTLPQYSAPNVNAKRRYNDFSWLREKLVERHYGCVVPPIPEKSLMGTFEKILGIDAKELIDYRQRALLKFLTRVGAHPILAQSEILQKFLELDEVEFNKLKEAKGRERSASSIGQKLREISFSVTSKVKSPELEWIEKQANNITALDNALKGLRDRLQDMVRKRKEMSAAISDFGKAFEKLGESEKNNAGSASDGLDANSTNNGTILGNNLSLVAQKAGELCSSLQTQADTETLQVVETLIYYIGMNEAVKLVLKKLESLVTSRDSLRSTLEAKRLEREKLMQQAGKADKVQKVDTEIQDLLAREQAAEAEFTKTLEIFKRDFAAFEATRYIDFNVMVNSFISLQIEYSQKVAASWEQILPK